MLWSIRAFVSVGMKEKKERKKFRAYLSISKNVTFLPDFDLIVRSVGLAFTLYLCLNLVFDVGVM